MRTATVITKLYDLTIEYDLSGEWTIICYGTDEDAPVAVEDKARVMLEDHDEICRLVDRLCREHAAEHNDMTAYYQNALDHKQGASCSLKY